MKMQENEVILNIGLTIIAIPAITNAIYYMVLMFNNIDTFIQDVNWILVEIVMLFIGIVLIISYMIIEARSKKAQKEFEKKSILVDAAIRVLNKSAKKRKRK